MEVEYWDLYNAKGEFLNEKVERGSLIPNGKYHRIIHIWIQNEREEFLIQKRASHLRWYGGRWATTTGSVISGQYDYMLEAYRELEEELSLNPTDTDLEYASEVIIGNSLVSIYKGFMPQYKIQSIRLNDEVEDIQWMKKSKIKHLIAMEEFAPYSEELLNIVFQMKL